MKWAAILLALAPSLAWAQGGPLQQGGAITPGHVARFVTNGVVGDGGSAQNGGVTEIGITGQGTPFCLNDAATTGPFHQLCFGANSLGGGLISFQAYNGAPVTPLMCNINGVQTACELSGSNVSNIPGPLTIAGLTNALGGIEVEGNVNNTGKALWVNGNQQTTGDSNINGNLSIGGSLYSAGVADLAGGLEIEGNVNNTGSALWVNGNQQTTGELDVAGLTRTEGGLDVSGLVPGGGGSSLYVNGNEFVIGTSNIDGELDTQSLIRALGGVDISGQVPGGGGYVLYVNGSAIADSWDIHSDRRLKTDIRDFKISGVAAIKQLRPVSYAFGAGPLRYGLIADEVQKVVPQAVGETKDGKTISLMALIDVLIAANRELAERVEALEKRLPAAH